MALQIVEHVSRTDVGRQRSSNEDALLQTPPLFAVADGMGGARAGEVASGIAVDMLAAMEEPDAGPEQRLEQAAQAANKKIFELAQADESRSGMGTTLTAVVFTDGHLAVAHVGDSRLYRWRGNELVRLTRDHSLVEELVRRGELDPDDVESHPQRAIITRALGPSPAVEVETFTTAARVGDVYLLCSDGLTTMVRDDRVAEIIRSRSSLEDAALRLVNTANENGGRDNVTVVLFRTGDAGAEDPLEDEHATRANLRVEDVVEAAAAHERTAESPAVPEPRATAPARSRPRARLRTTTTIFFVLLSIGLLIAGIWFGARQFYFLGENDQGVVTLFNGMPIDLPAGVSLYEPELVSEVDAEAIPPRQREVVLDQRLRSRGDALGLIENLERGQRAEQAAAERARRAQEARQRRESGGSQGGGSSGPQGGEGASRPSGSGQN